MQRPRRRTFASLSALAATAAILAAACSSAATGSAGVGPAESLRPEGSVAFPTVGPSDAPVTGEVPPEILAVVMDTIGEASGADMSTATIVQAEAVEWSDGSLGCPEPDMMYIQVITPGYQVVVEVGGERYDARVAADGGVVRLCDPLRPLGS